MIKVSNSLKYKIVVVFDSTVKGISFIFIKGILNNV